ncbi:MAG: ATP-binding protein [Planctomycetes bacterium]|nr:ATP-binding protein [Planctomycetota bacterium]
MGEPIRLEVRTAEETHVWSVEGGEVELPLTELLRRRHLPLNTRCGERGLCDGCLIELQAGELMSRSSDQTVRAEVAPQTVRGCEYRLSGTGPVTLHIPARSLLVYEPEVLTDFRLNVPRALNPVWRQCELSHEQKTERTLDELREWLRTTVAAHVGEETAVMIADPVEARLAESYKAERNQDEKTEPFPPVATIEFRPDGWTVTGLSEQATERPWGVAVDVGTTTVVILLVDLSTGRILARAADFNRQMTLGDNVLTRINLCIDDSGALTRLQELASRTIRSLARKAVRGVEEPAGQIVAWTVAGNTTMLHLLAGVDPSPMGTVPFTPRFTDHRVSSAADLRLTERETGGASPTADVREAAEGAKQGRGPSQPASSEAAADAAVHLLPGAAAYVGADLCAGVFSSGLVYDDGPSLLVDVGTNGEIIVKHGEHLAGCATAAGPAFEGARLTSGMRAGRGAISHIRIATEPPGLDVDVIENDGAKRQHGRPRGICGSGYIDFLAEGRRCGLLGPTGRFCDSANEAFGDRIVADEAGGRAFRIASGRGGRDILVSEADIALLLQAKAAIAAGIQILLRRAGVSPADVKTLYLAGGFGMFIDVPNAIACGLLPGFRPEQVQLVGNTSLAGAYLALLDAAVVTELSRIAERMEVVELNLDPDFESEYIDQLSLP